MSKPSLSLFELHRIVCKECGMHHKRLCDPGWRLFNDSAWIIARTPDPSRAKA